VVPRFVLPVLLGTFAVLIVTFGVLMGGYAIAATVGDQFGATVLGWATAACLIVLVVDSLLLLGTLGVIQLQRPTDAPERDNQDPTEA
jgi:hypothetical protein